jgi:hypothetical protein
MNDKYIIKENYHGDLKYILADKPKLDTTLNRNKVDLSKPTDATIKPIVNLDLAPKRLNSDKPICLTKPRDLNKTIPTPKVKVDTTTTQSVPVKSTFKHVTHYKPNDLRAVVKGMFAIEIGLSLLVSIMLGDDTWPPAVMLILLLGVSPAYVVWFTMELIYYKVKAKRDVGSDYSKCIKYVTFMEVLSVISVILLVILQHLYI